AEQKRHGQKCDQKKHSSRVYGGNMMGQDKVAQVHQASDRQPTVDSGGALPGGRSTARLKLTNPKIKNGADPDVEQQKRALERASHHLRVVTAGAADELFFGLVGAGRERCRERNGSLCRNDLWITSSL